MAINDVVGAGQNEHYQNFFPTTAERPHAPREYLVKCADAAAAQNVAKALQQNHADIVYVRPYGSVPWLVLTHVGEDNFPPQFLPGLAATILDIDKSAKAVVPQQQHALAGSPQ